MRLKKTQEGEEEKAAKSVRSDEVREGREVKYKVREKRDILIITCLYGTAWHMVNLKRSKKGCNSVFF